MTINIKIANDSESKEWDKLVDSSPHGAIFHTWKWLKIMEKHSGSKLYPVIGLKGTTQIGVYPLFYQKKLSVKTVFSPPPQLAIPYLGPALVNYDKLKQDKKESIFIELQRQVNDFISSELKPNYVSISSPSGLLDARPFLWTDYQVEPLYNYLIDLSQGSDYVWKGFKKRLRQNINRAKTRGISLREGFKEDLELMYDSLFDRYKEQSKTLPISKRYLLDIYSSFHPGNMRIFVAEYQREIVGEMVDMYYGSKVVSWLGSAKANVEGISPNELIQWEAIKWACEHEFKHYEEIGGNTPRLCHYKSKFNPTLSVYFLARKYSTSTKLLEKVYRQVGKSKHILMRRNE